jgi:CRP-like cAMP-binding protein
MGLHEKAQEIVRNRVLANLPTDDFEALRPHLTPTELKRHAIVQEANSPVKQVYFVESGFISRVARTHSDGLVEVAIVGRYGFVGISVALGTMISLHRTLVLIPGYALRIDAGDLHRAMQERPNIREHLLRYVHTLIVQNSQTALCNVRHELEQRLARWMLLACERLDDDKLPVTQDVLSMMLGVRRAGVSVVLAKFEAEGLIRKSRGSIDVLDIASLEQRACECYRIIQQTYDRLLPSMPHGHTIDCYGSGKAHSH